MKLRSFSTIISLSVFSLCAVNTATYNKTMVANSSATIKSITMALGVKGETSDPVNPTNSFKPTDTIHAVVKVLNAPANTKVGATWVAVDVGDAAEPNSVILSIDLTVEGTRNIDFTLEPFKPFPAGKYRVEISVDDELDSTKEFTVR